MWAMVRVTDRHTVDGSTVPCVLPIASNDIRSPRQSRCLTASQKVGTAGRSRKSQAFQQPHRRWRDGVAPHAGIKGAQQWPSSPLNGSYPVHSRLSSLGTLRPSLTFYHDLCCPCLPGARRHRGACPPLLPRAPCSAHRSPYCWRAPVAPRVAVQWPDDRCLQCDQCRVQ